MWELVSQLVVDCFYRYAYIVGSTNQQELHMFEIIAAEVIEPRGQSVASRIRETMEAMNAGESFFVFADEYKPVGVRAKVSIAAKAMQKRDKQLRTFRTHTEPLGVRVFRIF